MPIRAFKHIRSCDLDFYREKASFRISTLQSLRQREDLKRLHDPMEGLAASTAKDTIVTNGRDAIFDKMVRVPGILQISGDITFVDQHPDCWVWCVTEAIDAKISGEDYDAVVEIDDLFRVAKRIQIASQGVLGNPVVRPVLYDNRNRNFGDPGTIASPWIKGKDFEDERETRVCWPIATHVGAQELNVVAPAALDLLRVGGVKIKRT